jgi:hypothetical protein
LNWTVASDELFYTYWMRQGIVFLVARKSPGAKTRITFYASVSGEPIGAWDLDPADLLPYDAAAYASISRKQYSLIIGNARCGAGVLLDKWDNVRFVPETNALLLATYRPTSPPGLKFALDGETKQIMCRAKERWVQVELAP